jgi:hypothetical protein
MNQDFVDLLRAFVDADVRFLVVGAYALAIPGLTFQEAWPGRIARPFGEVMVNVIGLTEFVRNKRATGRAKDLGDIEGLQ